MTLPRDLSDLLLGVQCLSCGRGGYGWCRECVEASWAPEQSTSPDGIAVTSAAAYDGTVREALVAHKDHGQLALAHGLGGLLARAVLELGGTGPWLLVPCPSSRRAARRRGHHHVQRLAHEAARSLRRAGEAHVLRLLRVVGAVHDQVGLTATRRRANVAGAFVAKPPKRLAAQVIIVDDITTTGATLAEATRALIVAGWPVRGAAVVARTGPRMGVAGRGRLG